MAKTPHITIRTAAENHALIRAIGTALRFDPAIAEALQAVLDSRPPPVDKDDRLAALGAEMAALRERVAILEAGGPSTVD